MAAIPGYSSIAAFAREVDLPYMTAKNHMRNGKCRWPRRFMSGITKDPAYGCWENMIQRCTNSKAKRYQYYGGRGIKVCNEWRYDFRAFIEHIGPRPSLKHSIDRIDVNGNYEPGNVRWSTYLEQAQNRQEHLCINSF